MARGAGERKGCSTRKARGLSPRLDLSAAGLAVDGNKLTVDFDKAGRKMVLESYVEAG
jgi:hypothetical protein